jgi:hypothetical protein
MKSYQHPAAGLASLLFALAPASGILATFFPQFRGLEAITTICVAFLAPFFIVYSATRSRPRETGNALLTLSFAMLLLMLTYADIYRSSGLVVDMTVQPEPRPITTRQDAVYFSVVTWTTLGYGDIQPRGRYRYVAATEALVGMIFSGTFIAVLFGFLTDTKDP